jgi:hypothetical protein
MVRVVARLDPAVDAMIAREGKLLWFVRGLVLGWVSLTAFQLWKVK